MIQEKIGEALGLEKVCSEGSWGITFTRFTGTRTHEDTIEYEGAGRQTGRRDGGISPRANR